MGVEAIPFNKGQVGKSRALIVCDDCSQSVEVPCSYLNATGPKGHQPNVSQARRRALGMGWTYVKSKLRCPTCEEKRKVVPMKFNKQPEAPKEPTKRQRIEIFTMLAECYDIDAGRYQRGDTDETIADVLGVMPGWVSQIREAEFGPDGGNEDIELLAAKIDDMLKEMEGIKGDCVAIQKDAESIIKMAKAAMDSNDKKLAEVSTMKADLERIKKAVGTRTLKAAGCK
jgi:transcriptional regulator with XRE-family HTH domain